MKPKPKIIDGQALAKFVEKSKDAQGMVSAELINAWIIGENNHVQHNYPLYINGISEHGKERPFLAVCHSRDIFMVIDSDSFRKEWRRFLREAKP